MTDELDALLAAVHSTNDTLPRLVYADWLDDRGEHEYAELIRLGVLLQEDGLADPEQYTRVRERRKELSRDLYRKWNSQNVWPVRWSFGGTVLSNHVGLTAESLIHRPASLTPFFRPRHLSLIRYRGKEADVLDCPEFQRITELSLHGDMTETESTAGELVLSRDAEPESTADEPMLTALGMTSNLRLVRLTMMTPSVSRDGLDRFSRSPLAERLRQFAFTLHTRWLEFPDMFPNLENVVRRPCSEGIQRRLAEIAERHPAFAAGR